MALSSILSNATQISYQTWAGFSKFASMIAEKAYRASLQTNIRMGFVLLTRSVINFHGFKLQSLFVVMEYPLDSRPSTPFQTSPTRICTSTAWFSYSSHIDVCAINSRIPSSCWSLSRWVTLSWGEVNTGATRAGRWTWVVGVIASFDMFVHVDLLAANTISTLGVLVSHLPRRASSRIPRPLRDVSQRRRGLWG